MSETFTKPPHAVIGVAPVEVRMGSRWLAVIAVRTLVEDGTSYEWTEVLVRDPYSGRLSWLRDYRVDEVRVRP